MRTTKQKPGPLPRPPGRHRHRRRKIAGRGLRVLGTAVALATGAWALGAGAVASGETRASRDPLGPPGAESTYRLDATGSARSNTVERFRVSLGPSEQCQSRSCQWLSLQATKVNGQRFQVWILGAAYPPRSLAAAMTNTARYLLQEGEGPVREFSHRLTSSAVLPVLGAWEYLWPQPESNAHAAGITAPHVRWLGHPYVLETTRADVPFSVPQGVVRLALLPDQLVGTPSNTRTRDDTRRYDGSDYEMVRLTRADYAEMIGAGLNCFRVDAEQAGWLENEPVFTWGVGGPEIRFPECLFRSPYLGPALFLDEPAVGTRDHVIRPWLAQDPESRRLLTPQVMLAAFKQHFHEAVRDGAPSALAKGLLNRADVDVGTMRFPQRNLYSWETMIASAAWQLTAEPDGGPAAIVFEPPGRLGTRRTLPEMNMAYGCQLPPDDPENLAAVIVGFLRGAARVAGKDWGVSIYGAVDRADAPWLLTRAYDVGAKYFFFWDNYQLACVPYGECLALARHLRAHAQSHPDRDLARLRQAAESVILLPPGYDLGHTHMGRGNLWGLGELNLERRNRHGIRYREVMGSFFTEIERYRRLGVAFDLLWDLPGLTLGGYRETVRVREDGRVEITANGHRVRQRGPRSPPRSDGRPPHLAVELSPVPGKLPGLMSAQARVGEGASPVYYTIGTDRSGVYQNAIVLWELYGPGEPDYRTLPGKVICGKPSAESGALVEAEFRVEQPGHYRLRAAATDLAGRSAVVWTKFNVRP